MKELVVRLGMVQNLPLSLPAQDQHALATWAYLRALVLDPAQRGPNPPIPKGAYEEFHRSRQPPQNVAIWTNVFWGSTQLGWSLRSTTEREGSSGEEEFFLVTLTFLRLSLQVIGPIEFGQKLPREIEPESIFSAQRIWPLDKRATVEDWPADGEVIDFELLKRFSQREF